MPESPEVQALADELDARLRGASLTAVDVLEYQVVKTRSQQPSSLVDARVTAVTRHGKYVDVVFADRHLVVSLGRHGWARWSSVHTRGRDEEADGDKDAGARAPGTAAPALVTLVFDDGLGLELTDSGSWVSLATWVVGAPNDVPSVAALGPDPADPTYARADFDRSFAGRRKQLKAILQEQKSIAGIGNAYSDEILYAARLNPVSHASALTADQLERLFRQTVGVIRTAVSARSGIPLDRLKSAKIAAMKVHGKAGEPCPDCDDTIRDFAFAGTTAQYCPACQTDGVIL
ncbi:DNA-formamidopyrimidine glycosylase family protein [Humibacter ginsenosidimutans]|uniref:Fpg/Nei family DNA glycosylase n=1 Tax=Humibacter ginsenosidimutans TaxID=2599293 RepID=A0A5B8M371_9MICO|nr:DNA-formamidopyrimidine glycosylase family protein [Humibacter ginsenosidimutans]QDZ14394.1 Fpg/Nei family DNA glycosylase [Humibacter ginsenosidimutans]